MISPASTIVAGGPMAPRSQTTTAQAKPAPSRSAKYRHPISSDLRPNSVASTTPTAMNDAKSTTQITTRPDIAPPQLFCPTCDRPLVYRQTIISGIKPIERWDYFACPTCGPFVYRDRTRKLRSST